MKNLKFLLVAGLLTMSTSAFAQFANTGSAGGSEANTDSYNRVQVSYAPTFVSVDVEGADGLTFNGFSVGYIHGFSLSKTLPIFIETGLNLNYGFYSDEEIDGDVKDDYYSKYETNYSAMSLSVPVNFAYRFTLNDKFSITPYTGLNLKFNVLGKKKVKESEIYYDDVDEWSEDYNMFDKKEVGKDQQWKRFQIGWHIGAGVNYGSWYAGLEYGLDFNELCKKTNTSSLSVSVGYTF